MPRLPPSLIRQAGHISPHLAALLPVCRTLASAQTELRWIRAHAAAGQDTTTTTTARLVARRASGVPLQYVLGSQPFADLHILCRRGVLIPRPETEAWTALLADFLFAASSSTTTARGVRVLDLCAGTGCIGLALFARAVEKGLFAQGLRVDGFDIEKRAVWLARRNVLRNFRTAEIGYERVAKAVSFRRADIFRDEWMALLDDGDGSVEDGRSRRRRIDVLVSNPPYISQRGFNVDTGRSVRNYEPKIALVPVDVQPRSCAPEDVFYARLLEIADSLRPRVAVFEVGDMAQAVRVVEMVMMRFQSRADGEGRTGRQHDELVNPWDVIEIWRDWPDCFPSATEKDTVVVSGREVPIRGSGHGRVVFLAESCMMRNRFKNQGFRREFYED